MAMLFTRILELPDEQRPGVKIRQVVKWKYKFENDSILKALLKTEQDRIAIEATRDYRHELNKELYMFALDNQNEEFIGYCLKEGLIEKKILRDSDIVE